MNRTQHDDANDHLMVIKQLKTIPGVGKSIAEDLYDVGIRAVSDLNGADPEILYMRMCERQGVTIDRCLLYVLRCAVYFASEPVHDPELLKWWNWKERCL